VYVAPGPLAARLSYHTRQSIKGEVKSKLEFLFPSSEIKTGTKRKNTGKDQPSGTKKRKVSAKSSKAKGKLKAVEPDDRDDFGDGDEDEHGDFLPEIADISYMSDDEAPTQKVLHKHVPGDDDYESIDLNLSDENDDSTNNYAWSHSFLEEPRARFKPYLKNQTKASNRSTMNIQESDNEVIMLSSD
jgi:hypothetical protein